MSRGKGFTADSGFSGQADADNILYGQAGRRGAVIDPAGQPILPVNLDAQSLDAESRFEVEWNQVVWAGSGSHWLARGNVPPEWEGLDWSRSAAGRAQETAEDYLREIDDLEIDEQQKIYALCSEVTFGEHDETGSGAEQVSFAASTPKRLLDKWVGVGPEIEYYRTPAQRLAAVTQVAGEGGEWRFQRFYAPSIGEEYVELLYFHNQELYGSATIEHRDHDRTW